MITMCLLHQCKLLEDKPLVCLACHFVPSVYPSAHYKVGIYSLNKHLTSKCMHKLLGTVGKAGANKWLHPWESRWRRWSATRHQLGKTNCFASRLYAAPIGNWFAFNKVGFLFGQKENYLVSYFLFSVTARVHGWSSPQPPKKEQTSSYQKWVYKGILITSFQALHTQPPGKATLSA